ncbi:hypothetical protein BHE74_00058904 [Ensete ventricosum]|nr:hypothetical protein GW17_00058027 [Ensete ventricosum]RWW36102.1 hypothetical protein BHE74_00058904 [Ensete ventricosum]RZR90547.1 hypothetical protein BHM03_00018429 [Ensete ventricosum]
MLPLRFHNSGIIAKVFMRKISFKLRVMRLNRIESFYAFLLRFCSERNEKGRPAMARAPAGAVGYGQGPRRGCRTWPGPPVKAIACGQGCCRPTREALRAQRLQELPLEGL